MADFSFNRREFIKAGLAGVCLAGIAEVPAALAGEPSGSLMSNSGGIPLRPLGDTGVKVSILCLGGHHIGRIPEDGEAVRLVRYAIDNGVTFIDNAWEYHHGRSEKIVGTALKDGYRDKAFIMTKIHGRTRKEAQAQLEESLSRLDVEYVDLLQLHEVIYADDPERIFVPDGAIEVLEDALQQGKTRFVGFTGHKDPAIHLDMLSRDYSWDTVQMPVNAFDPHYRSFIKQVMPVLTERNIAPLGMKSMGSPWLLKSGAITAEEALNFAWSQPVSTVVSGMESMDLLQQNIDYARRFKPMSIKEQENLLARTASAAQDGKWEKYKTSRKFDGWVGRRIHDLPQ